MARRTKQPVSRDPYWEVVQSLMQDIMYLTGCKFSREPPLLSLALVEVQNTGRVWCRQKNVR